MDRREFLTAAGAGAMISFAGCSGALGAIAAPVVPRETLRTDGWTRTGEDERTVFEQTYGPVTLVAKAHSLTYGDTALRTAVKEKTLGAVDRPLALFAATRIEFDPNLAALPGGVGRGTILDRTESASREQFVSQMKAAGLTNVTQADTGTLQVGTGETARLTTYTAAFDFAGVDVPVANGETISIPGATIDVAGDLAVWEHDGSVLVAGGAYPASNFATTVSKALSSAITVTVDVDLGLTPDAYATQVRSLLHAVQ